MSTDDPPPSGPDCGHDAPVTDDALATPWSEAPLIDLDVLAVLPAPQIPEQRRSPQSQGGPWGDLPLPVPVPAWLLRERREGQADRLRRPTARA